MLKAEFDSQLERNQKSINHKNPVKKGGKRSTKEFVDLFALNNSQDDFNPDGDVDDERALTGDEKNLLKQFEENDQELEDIAAEIVKALDEVKHVAEDIEVVLDKQGKAIKKTR